MKTVLLILLVSLCTAAGTTGLRYADRGCVEQTGGIGLSFLFSENESASVFQIAYSILVFPCDMFYMGPALGFTSMGSSGYSESATTIGYHLGFVYNRIFPAVFVSTGIDWLIQAVSITNFGSGSAMGYQIPITLGLKIPVKNAILITPQITQSFIKVETQTMSTLSFGISFSHILFMKEPSR